MRFTYRDVNDFQKRNPTRATREDRIKNSAHKEEHQDENGTANRKDDEKAKPGTFLQLLVWQINIDKSENLCYN